MTLVIDASLALAFVLDDEATEETDTILESFGDGAVAVAPTLWQWEVANSLLHIEKRKRISRDDRARHLSSLGALPIRLDSKSASEAWTGALQLADRHAITVYDAAYLELARRLGLPLGSLDEKLRAGARAEGIKVVP